jgi:hypothetical protein
MPQHPTRLSDGFQMLARYFAMALMSHASALVRGATATVPHADAWKDIEAVTMQPVENF